VILRKLRPISKGHSYERKAWLQFLLILPEVITVSNHGPDKNKFSEYSIAFASFVALYQDLFYH
jgi:hypothetical protein